MLIRSYSAEEQVQRRNEWGRCVKNLGSKARQL
jgi:hypothetical protein